MRNLTRQKRLTAIAFGWPQPSAETAFDQVVLWNGAMPYALPFRSLAFVIFGMVLPCLCVAGTVRISFLTDSPALRDSVQFLQSKGCSQEGVLAFQQAVECYVKDKNCPGERTQAHQKTNEHSGSMMWSLDLSRFPPKNEGSYVFGSAQALVRALPHPLAQTKHEFGINCFDLVILLSDGALNSNILPDDSGRPFWIPQTTGENSTTFTVISKPTAREAFEICCPAWYREKVDQFMPQQSRDTWICLTPMFRTFHRLPTSTREATLRDNVQAALQVTWQNAQLTFPTKFQLVLVHDANLSQNYFVTAHAGLLFERERGFTYFEKAGGRGPFVRLDLENLTDLEVWLGELARLSKEAGSTHYFVTLNDSEIRQLETE